MAGSFDVSCAGQKRIKQCVLRAWLETHLTTCHDLTQNVCLPVSRLQPNTPTTELPSSIACVNMPLQFGCWNAESAHQKGATDQVEAMARDLEFTRAELASAKQNLDKAHSDQSKVCCCYSLLLIYTTC